MSMTSGTSAHGAAHGAHAAAEHSPAQPGWLARWLKRRRAQRRNIDHAVWDLRERYGAAAHSIALASARAPTGVARRRFWRRVAERIRRLD